MNIIQHYRVFTPVILILFILSAQVFADGKKNSSRDSSFAFSIEIGGGFTSNLNTGKNEVTKIYFSPTCGIFWKPNHLLDLGIEAAYGNIKSEQRNNVSSEFGKTYFKASLTGFPIILIYRMSVWKLNLTGGIGIAYVNSTIDAFNTKVSINYSYYSYYLSLGYTYQLTDRLGIGIDLLTYSIPRLDQNLGGLNFNLSYDFFKW